MNRIRMMALATAALLGIAAVAPASAHSARRHGPRVHFGFVFGAPLYPYWQPPPRYYYPAPIIAVPAAPPVYIEQGQPLSAEPAPPSSYWYFCADANAYYPYVKHCPGGWQRVSPQPPPE